VAGFFSGERYLAMVRAAEAQGEMLTEGHYDEASDLFVFRTTQDVEPMLDRNMEDQVHGDPAANKARLFRRVGHIPNGVIHDWLVQGFNIFDPNNAAELRRRMNSSEYLKLRTTTGRV